MGAGNEDTIVKAIGIGGLAFGVAGVLAPELLSRSYGLTDTTPGQRFMMRMWGTRNLVLGALMFAAPNERKTLATLGAGMSAMDSVIGFIAAGLPARTKAMAGLTSGAFAAAEAYVANAAR